MQLAEDTLTATKGPSLGRWVRRRLPLFWLALLLAGLPPLQSRPAEAQNLVWVRQFGSAQHDAATSVAVDPTGDVYAAGWTDGALPGQSSAGGPRDAFVRKYTRDGAELWTRQLGTSATDFAMAVAAGPAGDVHLAGQTGGALGGQSSVGEFDAFVRTYDRDGNVGWTRQFGSGGADAAAGLAVEPGGSIYVAGWTYGALPGQTPFGQYDAFVRKYDTGGSEVWTRQFGTPEHDRASRVVVDPTGNIDVAAGGSRGNVRRDSFARRYNPNGAEVRTRPLQASDIEDIRAVAVDPPGNTYVVGQTDVDHGHAFVRKYGLQGNEVWTRELHLGDSEVVVVDVAADPSGDVYVAGQAGDGQSDVFVRKYDRNGTEVWTSQLATSENDVASGLIVDPAGNVYLVGWTDGRFTGQSSAGRTDAFIAKLK